MIGWKTLEQATARHLLGIISSANMKQIELIGNLEKHNFPSFRSPTIANADGKPFGTMIWGRQRHHIPILLEIDVNLEIAPFPKKQTYLQKNSSQVIHISALPLGMDNPE
jgi:hypothetical protein